MTNETKTTSTSFGGRDGRQCSVILGEPPNTGVEIYAYPPVTLEYAQVRKLAQNLEMWMARQRTSEDPPNEEDLRRVKETAQMIGAPSDAALYNAMGRVTPTFWRNLRLGAAACAERTLAMAPDTTPKEAMIGGVMAGVVSCLAMSAERVDETEKG